MRAIGFNISSKRALENILKCIVETGEVHKIASVNSERENVAEIKKYFSPGAGVAVHGYYNEDNEFVREYYFPFAEGDGKRIKADIKISRHMGKTSFAGSCEDLQLGLTTIFYLQNGMDFIEHLIDNGRSTFCAPFSLTGLSSSGTIILPISKSKNQIRFQNMVSRLHRKWLNDAKLGDEEALENLTMEDYDLYSQAVKMLRKEDLFTIVDSTFMPYGVECDHYMVVGEIIAVKELENTFSLDKIYNLTINCNDMEIGIVINKNDLTGEPLVGRRFRGSIWLQGRVDFKHIAE